MPIVDQLTFRQAGAGEDDILSALACRVFDEFIATSFSQAGRDAYYRFAARESLAARSDATQRWVALDGDVVVGMLEVRDGSHVSMLFIEGAYQRRGVGRRLLAAAFGTDWPLLTVNSAPNAVGAYERLGFVTAAPMQQSPDGIAYVPMRRVPDAER